MVESYQQIFESMFFETFGKEMEVAEFAVLSAGVVNTGSRVLTEDGDYFVKMNERAGENFFQQEAQNLQLLRSLGLSTPMVYGYGKITGFNYLICELISGGPEETQLWQQAGRAIGFLHTHKNNRFGFESDNYLIEMNQDNRWQEDGIAFLVQNR
ncbi:MAG TPA: fructosamine kinase family protein, partial [Catalimonadaceae bacterium]|nr:fructosamine kinase family protein [Catalimonadaceae bacterium]